MTPPSDITAARERVELKAYDAGLLSDYGGGNVEWWQDYIRAASVAPSPPSPET